ncbi:MAG: 2-dehydro-3-deoxygalactonokinase [Bacteroidota bacterium]
MNHLLCCDWGTSNFRLYLVQQATRTIVGQVKSTQGIAATFEQWQKTPNANRIGHFRSFLQMQIDRLAQQIDTTLSHVPVVLSGMASSSIGIVDLPYAPLAFDLKQADLPHLKIAANSTYSNPLYLFTGLRTERDVMRGEEVQVLGLKHLLPETEVTLLLPGTHSKHLRISKHQIEDFKTYMTGEIFQILAQHSILKNSVAEGKWSTDDFQKGVLAAQQDNLLHQLFSVRTNTLLHQTPAARNRAFLSGLLIGTELKALNQLEGSLVLASSEPLFSLYKTAISCLPIGSALIKILPSDLEEAVPMAHLDLFHQINL